MADEEIRIEGLDELEKKLLKLGQETGARALVSSAYSANKKIQDSVKATLASDGSVDTGLLKKSIRRKKVIYADDDTVLIITGVSRNVRGTDADGSPRVPWRYAHIVQKFTKFMTRGMESAKMETISQFKKSLERKIKKYTK